MSEHPSHYALDRAVLGSPDDPEVVRHVARCARCARAMADRRAAPDAPPWLGAVEVRAERARPPWWRRWRAFLPVPALAALALVLAVAGVGRAPAPPSGAIRAKGSPVLTLYVKRGQVVSPWDGRRPLRPGDRLRLTVRGAGFGHVSVAAVAGAEEPVVLYEGPVEPDAETALPLSFRVEGGGEEDVLSVILARRPVLASEHAAAAGRVEARDTWSARLHLPKEVER